MAVHPIFQPLLDAIGGVSDSVPQTVEEQLREALQEAYDCLEKRIPYTVGTEWLIKNALARKE